MGMGPMTGRGAGYCAGYPVPGYANFIPGQGLGFGYGRGYGRGRGWRSNRLNYGPFQGYAYQTARYYQDANAPEFTAQQEAEMLKKEAKFMRDEINSIDQRISELESLDKKTE
jgi:hypothetical protein